MTPLFKFSLIGLGAASAGGGVICWNKRETIRGYFWGPAVQNTEGFREGDTVLPGGRTSNVQNTAQDSAPGGDGEPANPEPQAQDRRDQPSDNQNQAQQQPPGDLDRVPAKPQGLDGESAPGSKAVGGDPANVPQKPGAGVNPVPTPAPIEGDQTDPNATHQGREPSPDGTGQHRVEGHGAELPTGDGALPALVKPPGGAGESLPAGDRTQTGEGNPAPGSRAPEPGAGGLPGPGGVGDSPAEPSPDGQRGLPAPAVNSIDYQCLLNVGNHDTANKKAIKDFFDSRSMGSNQGVQIHDESYENGFKCARDMDDSELAGLKDYMEDESTNFSTKDNRGGNEPMVWAFKKDSSNNNEWTMYDDANVDSETLDEDGERGGILIAKTAKAEKGSGE